MNVWGFLDPSLEFGISMFPNKIVTIPTNNIIVLLIYL